MSCAAYLAWAHPWSTARARRGPRSRSWWWRGRPRARSCPAELCGKTAACPRPPRRQLLKYYHSLEIVKYPALESGYGKRLLGPLTNAVLRLVYGKMGSSDIWDKHSYNLNCAKCRYLFSFNNEAFRGPQELEGTGRNWRCLVSLDNLPAASLSCKIAPLYSYTNK